MTTTYKLVAFSRNVGSVDIGINKHSGYGLVRYEDGVAVAMKTVEVTASAVFGSMNFASSMDSESGYKDGWIPVKENNGNIIPQKVFENGSWHETTSDWMSDREYKVVPLKDGKGQDINNPEEVYRQIQNNADLLNASGMSYDPIHQNCNTWTDYIDNTILGGIGIFEQLNAGMTPPDTYIGEDMPFPFLGSEMYIPGGLGIPGAFMDYLKDRAILEQIQKLQEFLNDNPSMIFRELDSKIYITCKSISCTIICEGKPCEFITPIQSKKAPIEIIQDNFTTAHNQSSPLIIDLDGDGVETQKENSSVHFDHDGNGFAESSGWVGKDDGLLVRDINGNGQIDNGTELFGNNTPLNNGQKAA